MEAFCVAYQHSILVVTANVLLFFYFHSGITDEILSFLRIVRLESIKMNKREELESYIIYVIRKASVNFKNPAFLWPMGSAIC